MKTRLSVLLSGVDEFAERTSMTQQASEMLGFSRFEENMRDLYAQIAGWQRKDDVAMDLDDYGVLPEWAMPWHAGVVHQMFLEREGWFPLAGQHIKLCERNRFDNRFSAYEYLSRGERVVCLVSSARYWGVRCWSDTPADKERIKQELLAKKVK